MKERKKSALKNHSPCDQLRKIPKGKYQNEGTSFQTRKAMVDCGEFQPFKVNI